jgi:hypothetical protein
MYIYPRSHWMSVSELRCIIRTLTDEQVNQIEIYLNDRLVRKFTYKTVNQVLLEKIALITSTHN